MASAQGGKTDLPNAYRHVPMLPTQADLAVVIHTMTIMFRSHVSADTMVHCLACPTLCVRSTVSFVSFRQCADVWAFVLPVCTLTT